MIRVEGYEPPCCQPGSDDPMYELAPGVTGYAIDDGFSVYIPWLNATKPGNGDVGRFIDSLSVRCCFPTVISHVLAGMLQRRGYIEAMEWSGPPFDEMARVYRRPEVYEIMREAVRP